MIGASWGGSYTALSQVPIAWSIVGSGDFNDDGNADIVWQNTTTGDRSIWFMIGNDWLGGYAALPQVPIQWSIAGVGDFNADGNPDLVWQNTTTGDRSIWFMNRAIWTGAYASLPQVATAWKIAAVGDFDGDRDPDLVWQNTSTGDRSIWLMNGPIWGGSYSLLQTVPVPWRVVGAADFDGDSDPDLVWQNINTGERSVWFMEGVNWGGSSSALPTVSTLWSIGGVMGTALPSTGRIKVITSTTGSLPDPTGYNIEACCTHSALGDLVTSKPIDINSFVVFDLPRDTYTLTLKSVESNCTVANNARSVTLPTGATVETTFNVSCPGPTTGSIKVNTVTTGALPDPNGYAISSSVVIGLAIGVNDSKTITGFAPGTQSISLTGLASNCTTTSNPRNVSVTAGATVETTFNVSCPAVEVSQTFLPSFDNNLRYASSIPARGNTVFPTDPLDVGCNYFYNIAGLSSYLCSAAIMKFDVQSLIQGKTILEATLRIQEEVLPGDYQGTYVMAAVATAWNPATITYNFWENNVAHYIATEQYWSPITTTAVGIVFDVTAVVQGWANLTLANQGFMFYDDLPFAPGYESYQATEFASLESYTSATKRPQLFIRYR